MTGLYVAVACLALCCLAFCIGYWEGQQSRRDEARRVRQLWSSSLLRGGGER